MKRTLKYGALAPLGLFLVLSLALPVIASATEAPVLNFPFDEGQGNQVTSVVGSSTGTFGSGIGWASGKSGTAIAFDGKIGEDIVLGSNIVSGTEGSISFWFKVNQLTDRNVIFAARMPTDDKTYIALFIDKDGRPVLQARRGASDSEQKAQGSLTFNPQEWSHVVLTANTQRYSLFVNGQEIAVNGNNLGKWFSDLTPQQLTYHIGALASNDVNGNFDGMIDELRIYDRALNLTEATAIYNAQNVAPVGVPANAPKISLEVSPNTIPFGGSTKLTWNATAVSSCASTGSWSGIASTSGEKVFTNLSGNQSYGLRCSGDKGAVESVVNLVVLPQSTSTTVVIVPPSTGTGNNPTILTRALFVGSRNADVLSLQQYLISKGFLSASYNTGYFGKLTETAVKSFQKANGLAQVGVVGPLTRAKIQALP